MKQWITKGELKRFVAAICGTFLFAAGLNLFIVPVGLYSGGFVGFAQIVRSVLVDYMGLDFGSTDITGIIVYIFNIPLFLLAYFGIGKGFFVRTLVCVSFQSFFLTAIQIPAVPIIEDPLAACLIGGIICGYGTGLLLRVGASGGGQDILGLYFTRKRNDFSVGKMAILVNVIVFGLCLFLFNIQVVIYSLIYTFIYAFTTDKVHIQNINMEVMIFSKEKVEQIQEFILKELNRGSTFWEGKGGYTKEEMKIIYTVIDKHEYGFLEDRIHQIDEDAFVVCKEGVGILGNYIKKV